MRTPGLFGVVAACFSVVGGLVAGCMLVTGSTSGYQVMEAGVDAGPCLSAAGCGQGQVCCFGTSGLACETPAAAPASACGFGVQLCASASECPADVACVLQLCPVTSTSAPAVIKLCGLQSGCESVDGSGDAGAPADASPADGGSDARAPDASGPDAGTDAGPLDAGPLDAAADAPDGTG